MAQVIKIKRSDSSANPGSNLAKGELGYSYNSNKLFIGDGSTYDVIGGQTYVEMLDHTAGTLTASSAIIVGADSKIDNLLVDNIQLNGNTISTGSGNLIIDPATGSIDFGTGGTMELKVVDNSATALTIVEGSNNYLTIDTTNSAEKIVFNQNVDLNGKELIFDADADTSISSSIDDLLIFKSAGTNWLLASGNVGLTPTGSSVPLGSSGVPWSVLYVDNIKVDGNTITSENTDGDITLTPNGTGSVVLDGLSYPQADGSANQFLQTDGSGQLSFATVASTITLAADSGSNDTYTTGETLTFTGGSGIDTTVSDNTITIAAEDSSASNKGVVIVAAGEGIDVSYSSGTATISGEDATTTNKGIASFNSNDFTVSSGAVSIGSISNSQIDNSQITVGSTQINLGATASSLAGLTNITASGAITGGSLVADNITINGNEISSTDANGDISLNPQGTGTIDANNARVVNVSDPTGTQDAATKGYVDAVKQALDIKDSVRVATTANINIATALNVGDTIDGVELADGDRVLVKDQTTQGENGIYTAGATPARSADANTAAELTGGTFVFVEEGTVGADNGYVFTHNGTPATFGTTAMPVAQFSGAGQVIAGDALSKSGNTLNVNDDNKTLEVSADTLRIKGISATAVGDLLIGAGTNTGYTALAKPASNNAFLTMGTAGTASWTTTIDGGTF